MHSRKLAAIPAVCALLLCSTLASSQEPLTPESHEVPSTSGNAFLRLCSGLENSGRDTSSVYAMGCIGYIEGVADGVLAEAQYAQLMTNKEPPQPFCVPQEVENGQLIRILLKYIRNHPGTAHENTVFLEVKALQEAFPCFNKR